MQSRCSGFYDPRGPDVLPKSRDFPGRRFGELRLQEPPFARVSADLAQGSDFSVTLTQDEFAQNLKPLFAPPQLWAAGQKTLPILVDFAG